MKGDEVLDIYKEKENEALKTDKYPRIKRALENGSTLDEIEMEIQVGLGDTYFSEYVDLMGIKE